MDVRRTAVTAKTKVRCSRCDRRGTWSSPGWNFESRSGVIVAFLCPQCQTSDENAEAEMHGAVLDYGRDAFGRLISRPKV